MRGDFSQLNIDGKVREIAYFPMRTSPAEINNRKDRKSLNLIHVQEEFHCYLEDSASEEINDNQVMRNLFSKQNVS